MADELGLEPFGNKNDSLYYVSRESPYWLASRLGNDVSIGFIGWNGSLTYTYVDSSDTYFGLRPIVCLNSNVQLEKISNETYVIK